MELGIISLSDLTADPHTRRPVVALDRLDATLAYARAADELGLDVFALGEHHSHKFAVASPAVALAAIAGQTERMRLTSGVTVLSALDPVRVYQDFAKLDLVSHGRAEVIAGRSAFVEPFALFGAPMNEYDELFAEKLDLLLRLREHDTNNGRGFIIDRATFDAARRRDGALMIGTPEQPPRRSSTPRPSSASPASSASSTGADSRPRACTNRSRAWRPRLRPPCAPEHASPWLEPRNASDQTVSRRTGGFRLGRRLSHKPRALEQTPTAGPRAPERR